MPQLAQLQLSANLLTGSLPDEWSYPNAFPQLFDLELDQNMITGAVPSAWGDQTAFQSLLELILDTNNMTGTLPESWGSDQAFPQLQNLGLSFNKVQGTIPASWTSSGAFAELQTLRLDYTDIEGPLPGFHNSNLQLINLEGCDLKFNLTALWTSTAPLQLITISNASLVGSLPDVQGALEGTRVLDLGSNDLTGTVPLSWLRQGGLLSHVSYLDVGDTWTRSIASSSWRQQLCLQPNLYNIDTTGEQLSLLPGFRTNVSSLGVNYQQAGHNNDLTSSLQTLLQSEAYVSSVTESAFLTDANQNQLASVKEICANHNSHVVLLTVWLIFSICCLVALLAYACLVLSKTKKESMRLGPKSRLLPVQAAMSSFYEAFAGLGGLAFYYYDMITSIIVLRQVWGHWPGIVLAAIFLFHFAATGVVVAFHALYRLIRLQYDASQSGLCLFGCILALSFASSPLMIPVVLVLDTFVFVRQTFKALRYIVRLPGLKWMDSGYVAVFRLHHCMRPGAVLGLSWVDLESHESMHNFVAAIFQSLPTVILNSVLLSLGNKPSHGIFLSGKLFLAAVIASCLAMLRILIVLLWQSFKTDAKLYQYVFRLVLGNTLVGDQVKRSAQGSHVDLLVQQYHMSGSAPLGTPDQAHNNT